MPKDCPFKVILRNGESATVTSYSGMPLNDFPYMGFKGPPGNCEYVECWAADGSYHADVNPSPFDIVRVVQ